MDARGIIVGLTRGSSRGHIARAALESIAYQTRDILECMEEDSGLKMGQLKVDGGATANRFLMQFQADILGSPITCAGVAETTAQGAAYLAGLAVNFWKDQSEIARNWAAGPTFQPRMDAEVREKLYKNWKRATKRARKWQVE